MKINAIKEYNLQQKKNNNSKPAFAARIKITNTLPDVISDEYINIAEGPLKILVDKIKPVLEKFDDNLNIEISGAKKAYSFWNLFRDRRPTGIKFDVTIFDDKKYIHDILQDGILPQILKPEVFEGLKNRNNVLISSGLCDAKACVGKYYYPEHGETPEKYIKEVIPKLKEHIRLMPKFLFEGPGIEYRPKTKRFVDKTCCSEYIQMKRKPWEYYRGIEFDYEPIFKEFYK